MDRWIDKKIIFVSGKGGVGKSLIAAAVAQEAARAGRRVLLAEIGETSYFKDFWGLEHVGHDPVSLPQGFDLALWDGESCLREYVLYYLKMERLYKLFFENKVMRALVNVAPGLNEIAILGKITSGIRRVGPPLNYDLIVVDSYATGHALALLHAPQGMMEAIKFGPMGANSRDMDLVIRNPRLSGYLVVTLLEELPVTETIEFVAKLRSEFQVEPEVVANRELHLPVSDEKLQTVEDAPGSGLGEFARYLDGVVKRQKQFLDVLSENNLTVHHVPQIFSTEPQTLVDKAGEALRKTPQRA